MALDGMYLSFLVSKVNELLTGAKVDKIHQPSKNELVFIMRTRGGMHKLYFSADANSPRFAVTESVPENPQTPPMLCMLFRKRLVGATLLGVEQFGLDRTAFFNFDATNEIIRRITRYAAALSEKNALGANRKEEYKKIAELFMRCDDVSEAHKMSAMVFGMERPFHIVADSIRETDSINKGVYEETPFQVELKPRIRTYREKTNRSSITESKEKKLETRRMMLQQQKEEQQKLKLLERDGIIDFSELPILESRIREILLKWISDAMEAVDYTARTDDGEHIS